MSTGNSAPIIVRLLSVAAIAVAGGLSFGAISVTSALLKTDWPPAIDR